MYLIDTNVVSELCRNRPHGAVIAWIESVNDYDLYISAVTLAEIQAGIEITRDQDVDKAAELDFEIESYQVKDENHLATLIQEHHRNICHSQFVYPAVTLLTYPASVKANIPFTADGNANLKVRGERLTPSVDLALILDRFIFDEININKLSVKGQLDTAADWQTDVSVSVGSALVAEQQINSVKIDISGDKTDHQLTASVDAEQGSVEFEVNGKINNTTWNGGIIDEMQSTCD